MNKIAFMAGLPRSGSSLLSSLLRQNGSVHVSPTSDLCEAVVQIRNNWNTWDGFRSQKAESLKPRIRCMLRNMMLGFYSEELSANRLPIDKCRAWPAYIDVLEDIFCCQVKIICPIRNFPAIVHSFEKLRSANPLTYPHGRDVSYIANQDVYGRAMALMADDGTIGLSARRLIDAIYRGYGDRLIIVPYYEIINNPESVCITIFSELGVKPIEVRKDNLKKDNHSYDMEVYGAPLHDVGDKVEQWKVGDLSDFVLPKDLIEKLNNSFPELQRLLSYRKLVLGGAVESIAKGR